MCGQPRGTSVSISGAPRSLGVSDQRKELIGTARALSALTHGTSGNVSARRGADSVWVTPTGMDYDLLTVDDIPAVDFAGRWFGRRKPSSEWRFHRDILKGRSDVNAVVHCHSLFAVALACAVKGIPAFHYMVAVAGGGDIRCAPYATFGTEQLSQNAVKALEGRNACLLANHGLIAVGDSLAAALKLAGEVENLAAQYWHTLQTGEAKILSAAE